MLHKPAAQSGHDPASDYKSLLGRRMFLLYALVYAGFVVINVVNPLLMEARVFMGLNLAVVYGFGLIAFAMILALIYSSLCSRQEMAMADKGDSDAVTPEA